MLLAALADVPAHGYLVIQRIRERSGGVFDYPEGSVYPALHRLHEADLVDASVGDRLRAATQDVRTHQER